MVKNDGTKLQDKFQRWMKELDIYCQRFYDSKSMGKIGPGRPADFWCFNHPLLVFVECKSITSSKNLSFGSIRPSQYKAAKKAEVYGYEYVLLIEICKGIYIIYMEDFRNYMSNTTRKSIPIKDIKKIGTKITGKEEFVRVIFG